MWLASKQAIIHPGILGSEAKRNDETGFLGSKKNSIDASRRLTG